MSDAKNKLSPAAEALMEVATLKVNLLTQKKLTNEMEEFNRNLAKLSLDMGKNTDNLEELKEIVEQQSSEISKVSDNINTVNRNLNGIKKIMEQQLEQQLKVQKLSSAIANAHIASFEYSYVDKSNVIQRSNSKELVQGILLKFMNGLGHFIPSTFYISSNRNKEEFRAELKAQVNVLIGREPRLVQESNGRYYIYYS
ncbi:predicted protein [Chaetoceros tenuissimus]|uniref:Uncharacterized protein n=1 Tax=Chaetoceros tenuissimus TaxID=426638 RepID=A0AAD3HBA1_9STRA|nr:predicted protein [Chaetoceros tenuissimus]